MEELFSTRTRQFFRHEVDDFGEPKVKLNARETLDSLQRLRIDVERVKEVESGESKAGGQGTVVPSILRPEGASEADDSNARFIAVKKVHFKSKDGSDFDTEKKGHVFARFAYELLLLSRLSHENIVHVVGFVEHIEAEMAWMIFDWEANGNMREFVASANLELPERLWLVHGVAKGLAYLHGLNTPICHGDLKSLNILINKNFSAVITDFGSARAIVISPDTEATRTTDTPTEQQSSEERPTPANIRIEVSSDYLTLTGQNGSIPWSAPELLEHDRFDLATDIWAFGWICWEAVTGNFPFHNHDHSSGEDVGIILQIIRGKLPVLRDDVELQQIQMVCSLMEDCWEPEAFKRPTARKCQQTLSVMDCIRPEPRNPGAEENGGYSSGLLRSLGSIRRRNGQMQDAMKYFKQSLEVAEAAGDWDDTARALLQIGKLYYGKSNHAQAEEHYTLARKAFARAGNLSGIANTIDSLGDVYQLRGEYAKAEEAFIHARDAHSWMGNQLGVANAVQRLGHVYKFRGDQTKAEECYILARDTFIGLGDHLGMANAVQSLGDVYRARDNYAKAEECFILARDTHSRVSNQLGMANAVRSLGDVYRFRGDQTKAEECYILARDTFIGLGDHLGMANAVQSLGEVYRRRGDQAKAKECFILARDTHFRVGNQLGMANAVRSLGDVYRFRGDHTKAEECYTLARDTFVGIGDQLGMANAVRSLGDVHRSRSDYTRAEECYILARDTYSAIGDELGMGNAIDGLGDLYRTRGNSSKAEKCYILARRLFIRVGNRLGVASAFIGLGVVYHMRKKYDMAEVMFIAAGEIASRLDERSVLDASENGLKLVRSSRLFPFLNFTPS